jgi:hypothetical protein
MLTGDGLLVDVELLVSFASILFMGPRGICSLTGLP